MTHHPNGIQTEITLTTQLLNFLSKSLQKQLNRSLLLQSKTYFFERITTIAPAAATARTAKPSHGLHLLVKIFFKNP